MSSCWVLSIILLCGDDTCVMDSRVPLTTLNKVVGSIDVDAALLEGDAADVPRFLFLDGCESSCMVSLDSEASCICTSSSLAADRLCRSLSKFSTNVRSSMVVKPASRR